MRSIGRVGGAGRPARGRSLGCCGPPTPSSLRADAPPLKGRESPCYPAASTPHATRAPAPPIGWVV